MTPRPTDRLVRGAGGSVASAAGRRDVETPTVPVRRLRPLNSRPSPNTLMRAGADGGRCKDAAMPTGPDATPAERSPW